MSLLARYSYEPRHASSPDHPLPALPAYVSQQLGQADGARDTPCSNASTATPASPSKPKRARPVSASRRRPASARSARPPTDAGITDPPRAEWSISMRTQRSLTRPSSASSSRGEGSGRAALTSSTGGMGQGSVQHLPLLLELYAVGPSSPAVDDAVARAVAVIDDRCPQAAVDGMANLWVVKAGGNSKGVGIDVFRRLDTLMARRGQDRVVQKYVEQPQLIRGCKYVAAAGCLCVCARRILSSR